VGDEPGGGRGGGDLGTVGVGLGVLWVDGCLGVVLVVGVLCGVGWCWCGYEGVLGWGEFIRMMGRRSG